MKSKKIKIVLIIFILIILGIIYIPNFIKKTPETKVKEYIKEKYGDTVNNVTFIKSGQEKENIWCDGSTPWYSKVKDSEIYYYSAYSINNDFTFYIYYNDNKGKDLFIDTLEINKRIKEECKNAKDYITFNLGENNINITFNDQFEPSLDFTKKSFINVSRITIRVDINEKLRDIINEEYISKIEKIAREISKYIETENYRAYTDITFNYDDNQIFCSYGSASMSIKEREHVSSCISLSEYLKGIRNGIY